ncbi:hypothetical protein K0M31_017045 [Melipona bicolor]|uniref:Uncharacterized protein n=1 Tax=Melipona bicolor TaxID=60889 RepID=A0AA40KE39_9HYME|nr:hypothetical protein K0M31_017045 [Melipona bicolor]
MANCGFAVSELLTLREHRQSLTRTTPGTKGTTNANADTDTGHGTIRKGKDRTELQRVRRVEERERRGKRKEEEEEEEEEAVGKRERNRRTDRRKGRGGEKGRGQRARASGQWARLTFPRCLLAARPPLACYSTVRSCVMRVTLSSPATCTRIYTCNERAEETREEKTEGHGTGTRRRRRRDEMRTRWRSKRGNES